MEGILENITGIEKKRQKLLEKRDWSLEEKKGYRKTEKDSEYKKIKIRQRIKKDSYERGNSNLSDARIEVVNIGGWKEKE